MTVADAPPRPAPTAPPPPGPVRGAGAGVAGTVGSALFLLAVLVIGFVLHLTVLSQVAQNRAQENRYDDVRRSLAEATAPFGGAIEPGTPVAVLEIPSLGVREVVVEGTTGAQLQAGPGHRRDTPLPGQPGVSVLAGRRAAYGGPFAGLAFVEPGDPITVITGQGTHTYRVDGVRVEGDPLPFPLPAGGGRLTLVTAAGPPYLPDGVRYVDATLTSPAQPVPAARPAIGAAEKSLSVDPAATLPLLFWLQLLSVAVAGTTWALRRWGRTETYLVGTPVVLALVWNLYESVARLLPNLL